MVQDVQGQQVPKNTAPEVSLSGQVIVVGEDGFEHELIITNLYSHLVKNEVVACKFEMVYTTPRVLSERESYDLGSRILAKALEVFDEQRSNGSATPKAGDPK